MCSFYSNANCHRNYGATLIIITYVMHTNINDGAHRATLTQPQYSLMTISSITAHTEKKPVLFEFVGY